MSVARLDLEQSQQGVLRVRLGGSFEERQGIAGVYTPKDFELDNIMSNLIDLVDRQHAAE